MKLHAVVLPLCAALFAASCGSGPTDPSPTRSAPLAGVWRGEIRMVPDGMQPISIPTEWTLSEQPNTSGMSYRAELRSSSTWFAPSLTASTTLTPMPPATAYDVHTIGFYASPRGCQGSFQSITQATNGRLSGSFYGVDCAGIQFNGSVSLTK